MRIHKHFLAVLLLAMVVAMPSYGQRFTKREQALREARAINYFYGHSFTLSSGYVHSWLTTDRFTMGDYGRTGLYGNTRESMAFSFAWDICKSRYHGFQVMASYAQMGGEKLFYEDLGLGYGPQQRYDLTEQIHLNQVMVHGAYRFFIPLSYKSRLSIDAGVFMARMVGKYDNAKDWDMGPQVGIGYDWKRLSVSCRYVPGVYGNVIENSDARIGSLTFSVGVHMWK